MNERIDNNPRSSKIRKRVAVMTEQIESTEGVVRSQFRLGWGLRVLDEWADTAGQIQRNAVYEALFAVSDRSVFAKYKILDDDDDRPLSFYVVVHEPLVIKIQVRDLEVFGIGYIGSFDGATTSDLDRVASAAG